MAEFLQLMEDWSGYNSVSKSRVDEAAVAGAIDLITNKHGVSPRRHAAMLEEAITTTAFPNLFGVAIDRQILALYRSAQANWRAWFKVSSVPNFNTHRRHKVQGNDNYLPEVSEKGEYLVSPMDDSYYTIQAAKYGRQFDISWEAIINDSMSAFADIPERFSNAAINSLARSACATYASAAGPNTGLFGATITDVDAQDITNEGVLPLTIANLEATLALMSLQTDMFGKPISVRGVHLVVPPQLEFTARQILTSGNKMWLADSDDVTPPAPYPTTNVLPQMGIQLHVDPWLPVIDETGTDDTTWYLFGDPSQGAAVEFVTLRGYEDPEICMKSSDKVTTGGGPLSPFSGDFATDNIFYRVRLVYGFDQMDPRFAYAQVGP